MDHAINRAFREICQQHRIKHLRTRPYTPHTNGKAERFIQTLCRSGPTVAPITPRKNAPPIFRAGSMTTIDTALMLISARSTHLSFRPRLKHVLIHDT